MTRILGFDLSSLSLNANGGIYQSADLSRYSGTVVNRPTFFAFAKGAGVMGEAGPEAILPLRRGADGKLGVVADSQVTQCYDSPPVQAGFFVG